MLRVHFLLSLVGLVLVGGTVGGCAEVDANDPGSEREDSVAEASVLWPQGDIYIVLADDIRPALRIEVENTAADLAEMTPIRVHFISDGAESPSGYWLHFDDTPGFGSGGFAPVGVTEGGEANSDLINVRHEFGHIAGLGHTQGRADRDENITVHTDFIAAGRVQEFRVLSDYRLIGPYDSDSIMHYTSWAFAEGPCASMSMGVNEVDECVEVGDARYKLDYSKRYTDWNLSSIAALYCQPRYCGDQCADEARCDAPIVRDALDRLYLWESSEEGLAHAERWPQHRPIGE